MNDVQAKFDIQKLKWMNGEYIMKIPADASSPSWPPSCARDGLDPRPSSRTPAWPQIVDLYKIRIKTLREFGPMVDFFFREDFAGRGGRPKQAPRSAREPKAAWPCSPTGWPGWPISAHDAIEALFRELAEEKGIKPAAIIHPARMAVSGKTTGAGLFEIMEVLGRETVVARMKEAAR